MDSPPTLLPVDSELGQSYIAAMQLAGEYAYAGRDVVVAKVDEAPEVYKRLPEVLAAHGSTIRVKHTLRPLGVAMAGRDVVDPYKD
jgi:RNA-splicing ligase RtcB